MTLPGSSARIVLCSNNETRLWVQIMQQFWQWVIIIINIPSQRLRKYPFLLGRQSLLPVTCSQKVSLYFYKFNPSFQKVNPYLQKIKPSYGTVNPSFQKVNPFFQKVNPSFQKVNPYFQKVNPSHWKSIPIFGKQTSSGKETFWIVNLQLSVSVCQSQFDSVHSAIAE